MKKLISTLYNSMTEIKETLIDFFSIPHFFKKVLFIFGIYILAYLPLIRSFMIFAADNKRVIGNTHPWITGGGRYLNDWLVPLLFASPETHDIQPLPRIFALFILSIATLMFVYIVSKKTNYIRLLMGSIIGLSPFFVQNISYSFDAPYMCASSLFAIIPFLFWDKKNGLFTFLSVICAFVWLGFYQSAISCYLMLLIYLSFLDFLQKDKKIKHIIFRIFIGFTSVFICSVLIDLILTYALKDQSSYTTNHLPLCTTVSQCVQTGVNNFYIFLDLLKINFKGTHFVFFFIALLIAFTIHIAYQAGKITHRFQKTDNILISLLIVIGLLLSLFIYQSLLLTPQFDQRTITSLGMIVSIFCLNLSEIKNLLLYKLNIGFTFILVWCLFVFVATYGNLWAYQMQYDHYLISHIRKISSYNPQYKISFPQRGFHIPLIDKQDNTFQFLINCIIKNGEARRIPAYYNIDACNHATSKNKEILLQTKTLTFTKTNNECIHVEYTADLLR